MSPNLLKRSDASTILMSLLFVASLIGRASAAKRYLKVGEKTDNYKYPWNPEVDYEKWVKEKTLNDGDIAVFYFPKGANSVWSLTSLEDYENCNTANGGMMVCSELAGRKRGCWVPITDTPKYIVSGITDFCKRGQKLILQAGTSEQLKKVSSESTASSATAYPIVKPLKDGRAVDVGYPAGGLNFSWNPLVNYTSWSLAPENKLFAGDVVVFRYPLYGGQVWRFFRKTDYDLCQYERGILACGDAWGVNSLCSIRLTSDPLWLATGLFGRCRAGHKVALNVTTRIYQPKNVVVGYETPGYNWPWNPQVNFTEWLLDTRIYINDTLEFRYAAYQDTVYLVPSIDDYNNCTYTNYIAYCSDTDGVSGCVTDPLGPGTYYFLSGKFGQCMAGQRVIVTPQTQPTYF